MHGDRRGPAKPESPVPATLKYNPHRWGAAELRGIFVVRLKELDLLSRRLRETGPGTTPQHVLIVGPRGMGKSTLLLRLALAVDDDAELSRHWLPLTLPEEQYTVSTLAEFWTNVLDSLADKLETQGASAATLATLDDGIRRLGGLPIAEREDAALTLLTGWIRQDGRRLLLLVDSNDLLFSALGGSGASETKTPTRSDPGSGPLWRLRRTLTHETGLFWIGASYQALEAQNSYHHAFQDFFEYRELPPLTVADMERTLLALARTFGLGPDLAGDRAEAEMAAILKIRPGRLKALRTLTGGNPRTTMALFDLFATRRQQDLQTDLLALLDTMTPLYKARMESLAEQPRKLLAHLMEHWAPMGSGDLAAVSGIPTNTISPQLRRLIEDGLVEKAALPGTKRTGYQVSERLFNIWYLMRFASRRLRQRLVWLVEFMRLWFSTDEWSELAVAHDDDDELKPLAIQAHLNREDRELARHALAGLAARAAAGEAEAFFQLRSQCRECHRLGLGHDLAAIMENSAYAGFLLPFALALHVAATGDRSLMLGVPAEALDLAEEVLKVLEPIPQPAS
ncbi:MAG: AAA family ATPase [Azospirillaceae bacterium]|nr:AAA family ATPase [Azospirillaceae bacterium]